MSWSLNLDADQRQVLDAAQALLDEHYPLARLRAGQHSDDLAPLAAFGGFSLALPEALDGTGFTLVEEALLHGLFGHHLLSTRTLAAPLGARLCAESGQLELGRQLAAGTIPICAGIESRDHLLLLEPKGADYALIWGGDGMRLLNLAGAALQDAKSMGQGRPMAKMPAPTIVAAQSGDAALSGIADLLVSAQLLGVAQAALTLAVSYARLREQFGRPIGSFQAIKHQCADMAVRVELLSAQLDMAAIAARDGRDDAAFQIAALRRLAPKAALANARRAIQIHGGIGFSAEADPHHLLKQAHMLQQLGGHGDLMALTAPLAPHERH